MVAVDVAVAVLHAVVPTQNSSILTVESCIDNRSAEEIEAGLPPVSLVLGNGPEVGAEAPNRTEMDPFQLAEIEAVEERTMLCRSVVSSERSVR